MLWIVGLGTRKMWKLMFICSGHPTDFYSAVWSITTVYLIRVGLIWFMSVQRSNVVTSLWTTKITLHPGCFRLTLKVFRMLAGLLYVPCGGEWTTVILFPQMPHILTCTSMITFTYSYSNRLLPSHTHTKKLEVIGSDHNQTVCSSSLRQTLRSGRSRSSTEWWWWACWEWRLSWGTF